MATAMRRVVLAVCVGAGGLGAAGAQALTGAELYNYCSYESCGGYFVGAFDAIRTADAIAGGKRGALAICPPETVSDEEVVDVAMRYLEAHPRQRHLQAANLSLRAWVEARP